MKLIERGVAEDGWRSCAACRGLNPEIWYPDPDRITKLLAVAVCADCPVRQQCLDYAVQRREPLGIWGGKTPYQRSEMLTR
jgi:WhiB family transcriptional regulator, redox-sensing transcriptional regulator